MEDLQDYFSDSNATQKYKFYREQILRNLKLLNDNLFILAQLQRYMTDYHFSRTLFRDAQYFLERCYLNIYQNSIMILHRSWSEKRKDSISFRKYVEHIRAHLSPSSKHRAVLMSKLAQFNDQCLTDKLEKIFRDIRRLRHKLLAHERRELLINNNDKTLRALITRQFALRHPRIDELMIAANFLNERFHLLDFTTDHPISMNSSGFHHRGRINSCIEVLDQLALNSEIITEYDDKDPGPWEKKFSKRLKLKNEHIQILNEIRSRNGLPEMDLIAEDKS